MKSLPPAFIDLLFNLLLGIFLLFLFSVLLITDNKKRADEEGVPLKAEIMITLKWPDKHPDDIDLGLLVPPHTAQDVVFYKQLHVDFASLERDDQGLLQDSVLLPSGTRVVSDTNIEHLFIRKLIPGVYYVAVHMYAKRKREAVMAEVEVTRLNPYGLLWRKQVPLSFQGEEGFICSFEISESGEIGEMDDSVPTLVFGQLKEGVR